MADLASDGVIGLAAGAALIGLLLIGLWWARRSADRPSGSAERPPEPPKRRLRAPSAPAVPAPEAVSASGAGGAAAQALDAVDVSVFGPSRAEPGAEVQILAVLHEMDAHGEAVRQARDRVGAAAEELDSAALGSIACGAVIELRLISDDLAPVAPSMSGETDAARSERERRALQRRVRWRGATSAVSFDMRVLPGEGPARAHLDVLVAGELVGMCALRIDRASGAAEAAADPAKMERFERIFLSYSSRDRLKMLERADALASLPNVEVIFDQKALSAGDRFEMGLTSLIQTADLFLVFWSRPADDSEWVAREIDIALEAQARTGKPQIRPVLLEGPPIVEPPQKLADMHFNSPIRYFILAQMAIDAAAADQTPAER